MFAMFIATFCFFGQALAAPTSPDETWNEFTNNFATDIAPLVTLFGEQVTKQFLSESTGLLDNIIFGMAPLGILTAVVSAIRVYGWPGLKAFIGRAQEPHGVAEAELCSSTSRDVCELWSEGGICRVFGRPKVLEFFHKAGKDDFYPKFTESTKEKEVEHPGACNLYRPVCFLDGKKCCRAAKLQKSTDEQAGCEEKDSGWREDSAADSTIEGDPDSGAENGEEETKFAPYPNLSLNIGIRATPQWVLILVAAFGSLLQLSFFGYATYVTFYRPDFYSEGKAPEMWSFVLTVLGTTMVVLGMILCAFLIERKSYERRFAHVGHDGAKHKKVETTMYWLQPGDQRVGDQQFNAFSHNQAKHTYITSWKTDQGRDQLDSNYINAILIVALFSSMVGFILQFTGLRGLHGSVALYQIAATLVMSIIRAVLRLRRLDPSDNNLRTLGAKLEGHELDWQAMNLFVNHAGQEISLARDEKLETPTGCLSGYYISPQIKNVKSWRLCDYGGQFRDKFQYVDHNNVEQIRAGTSDSDLCLFGFRHKEISTYSTREETWSESLVCANEAIHVASLYEGVFSEEPVRYVGPNPVAMTALFRSRLAYLTGDGILGVQPKWDGPLRKTAEELQSAIQGVTNYIFSGNMLVKENWQDILAMTWHTTAIIEYNFTDSKDREDESPPGPFCISFPMFRYGREWKISKHRLEAVIGLWASSLERVEGSNDLNDKVLLLRGTEESTYSILKLWIPTANLKLLLHDESVDWTEAWLVQAQKLVLKEQITREGNSADNHAISMRAKSSKIRLLAQNIFMVFISRLAKIMRVIHIPDKDLFSTLELSQAGPQKINSSERLYGLSNSHVNIITKLFVQSGLGTEEEALMCVIPVFIQAGILPQGETFMNKLVQSARNLRRNNHFRQAEMILKVMLENPHPKTREIALREIGEVYRKAYRTQNRQWALDGLEKMSLFMKVIDQETIFVKEKAMPAILNDWPKPYRPSTKEMMIFQRYADLVECLGLQNSESTTSELINHLETWVNSSRENLTKDSSWENLTRYLSMATRMDFFDLQISGLKRLVYFSIKSSFIELLEDLMEHSTFIDHRMIRKAMEEAFEPKVDTKVMETMLDIVAFHSGGKHMGFSMGMAFCSAIRARRMDIIRLLYNHDASINIMRGNDRPLIFDCIQYTNGECLSSEYTMELMTFLIELGADINAQFRGETLMSLACSAGNHTAVKLLIDHHVSLRNQKLLNITAKKGDTVLLQTLLEAGLASEINKDYSETYYDYNLHQSETRPQFPEAIKCFCGAVDYTFGTALHTAIQSNQAEVVEMLLKRNDCNLNIHAGETFSYAIIIACFIGSKRILDMLFAEGPRIDLNVVGTSGSALAVSCAKGDTVIVQELIKKGAKVTESRGTLGSPLVLACLQGCDEIVGQLVRKDSTNKDCPGIGGLTPLCAAVKGSNLRIVQMLIGEGADVNLASSSGTTPLLLAVSTEPTDLEIVTALLEAKADTNQRGGEEVGHLTPLEMCREKGNELLVEALKRAGAKDTATPSAELLQWRKSQADGSEKK
ncbi:hypothetical protein BS50DRAFT_617000 [Corynespora cassiicola Philippines]|uniref:Uncharacterized protein n=1 Tax=Corynespora cassiicola Philippines TaxID=1448308 RepID=A0A2T2P7R4_CORCC|nr:hypothetical protein BS50DRAFT_617000 [Corynespora cassiicola Philippines]